MATLKPSLLDQYNLSEADKLQLKELLTHAGEIDLDTAHHFDTANTASSARLQLDAGSQSDSALFRQLLREEQNAKMEAAKTFGRFDALFDKAGDGKLGAAFIETRSRLDRLAPGDSETALELGELYASLGVTPPSKLKASLEVSPPKAELHAPPEIPHYENEVEGEGLAFPTRPKAIPEEVLDRTTRKGNRYLDANNPSRTVFVDYGSKLQTPQGFDGHAVRSMVAVAEARGWHSIKVSGSEDFRRAVFMEAATRGLEVSGYKPTDAEKAAAEKAAGMNGNANKIEENPMVKVYRASQTPEDRKEAAKQHPNLKNAYALESALTRFAEQRLQPGAREAFIERSKQNIAADLAAGVSFNDVLVRKSPQSNRPARTRTYEAEQSH